MFQAFWKENLPFFCSVFNSPHRFFLCLFKNNHLIFKIYNFFKHKFEIYFQAANVFCLHNDLSIHFLYLKSYNYRIIYSNQNKDILKVRVYDGYKMVEMWRLLKNRIQIYKHISFCFRRSLLNTIRLFYIQ